MSEQIPLPPKIAAAIVAIMGAVPKLERTEKNTHGNYNFASIDDFLEAVRPLCAAHGLVIIQDEDSLEISDQDVLDARGQPKKVKWLTMRYSYTLAHSSGETWGYRPSRTIMVNAAMGSQAFGAAQSYSLKQFIRSLLQIATGEKDEDADTHKPESLPASRKRQAADSTPAAGTTTPSHIARGKFIADDLRRAFDEGGEEAVRRAWRKHEPEITSFTSPKIQARLEAVFYELVSPPDDTDAAIADLEGRIEERDEHG